jgi:hypothetical protein
MIEDDIEEAIDQTALLLCKIEGGIEQTSINWRTKSGLVLIEELSDDDTLSHFRFRKEHLQEMSDKLWPSKTAWLPCWSKQDVNPL